MVSLSSARALPASPPLELLELTDRRRPSPKGHYYVSDCFGSAFVSFNPFPPVSFVSDPASTTAGKVYVANDAESIINQYDEVGACLLAACASAKPSDPPLTSLPLSLVLLH